MPTGVYVRKHRKVTPEMRAQIFAEVEQGDLSHRQISAKYKLNSSAIGKMVRADQKKGRSASLTVPGQELAAKSDGLGNSGHGHLLPQMQALRAEGFSYRIIAQKLGIGDGRVGASCVGYYLNPKRLQAIPSVPKGVSTNGHEQLDTRFLVGFGCAELERTLATIAQRLGIPANLLRQGFSRFLGSTQVR
jgi:transposase-like protein